MAGDPPGARLLFYILGDTRACTRFLVSVVVLTGTLAALAILAPPVATALTYAVAGLIGGRAALRRRRVRPADTAGDHTEEPVRGSRRHAD